MPEIIKSQGFFELWHPEVLGLIMGLALLYWLAVGPRRTLWFRQSAPVHGGQMAAFVIGLSVIYLSEGTPLHTLSDSFLFSAHMLQHMLLTLVMPPLLLLGTPDWLLRPMLCRPMVARVWRLLTTPLAGVLIFTLVFSLWHFPALYQSALRHEYLHVAEHAFFVPAALIMWWPLLSPMPEFPRPPAVMQLFYIFLVSLGQIAIHSILTFADSVLYQTYALAPRLWGVTALLDQQWAGMIMNISTLLILTMALFIVFAQWSRQEDAKEPRAPSAEHRGSVPHA